MQSLLERRSSFQQQGGGPPRFRAHALVVLLCVGLAAYVALVLLPTLSTSTIGEDSTPPSPASITVVASSPYSKPETPLRPSSEVHQDHQGPPSVGNTMMDFPSGVLLEGWGYNKERNLNRWRALYQSIAADMRQQPKNGLQQSDGAQPNAAGDNGGAAEVSDRRFLVVDYGADQGYFSLAIANAFPEAVVMAVEAGGVGGSIWEKGRKLDVLQIQEHHAERLHIPEGRLVICQTKVRPQQFFDLAEKKLVARYQLVLSVFHWFKLPTVDDFQRTLVTLLMNAETTFLELPTIGDRGTLIRKQVGWEHFSVWYQNHTSVRDVIAAACEAEHLTVRIQLLVSAPWLKWTRDVFRIDVDRTSLPIPRGGGSPKPLPVQCILRTSVYQCAPRLKHASCPPPLGVSKLRENQH